MRFTFDDNRVVDAKVMETSGALEKYDDAIAAGKGGLIMQKDHSQNFYQLYVGNIPPEGTVKVEIEILSHIEASERQYHFKLPVSFAPRENSTEDKFKMAVSIKTGGNLTEISHPQEFTMSQSNPGQALLKLDSNRKIEEVFSTVNIWYRTSLIAEPHLLFQKSDKYPDEVAILAQFAPASTLKQQYVDQVAI